MKNSQEIPHVKISASSRNKGFEMVPELWMYNPNGYISKKFTVLAMKTENTNVYRFFQTKGEDMHKKEPHLTSAKQFKYTKDILQGQFRYQLASDSDF